MPIWTFGLCSTGNAGSNLPLGCTTADKPSTTYLWRLGRRVSRTGRHRVAFGEEFEMVNNRLHRRLR